MLSKSPDSHPQTSLFGIVSQLNQHHPLLALGQAYDWAQLESALGPYTALEVVPVNQFA